LDNTNNYNEPELLKRLSQDDHAALNAIIDQYHRRIYEIALMYIKITQSAEDVTQEVFYKVWKDRHKLGAIANLKNYLFILARNETFDALRKKGPQFPVGEYLEQAVADREPQPERILEAKNLESLIQKAVALLPPQQREAFRLSREADLSHDQIAARMNIAKNTVKNHIVSALNFIRQYIKEHDQALLWLLPLLFHR
jgi:RNA polymerase sigma-70 factor (ECF subfamily)